MRKGEPGLLVQGEPGLPVQGEPGLLVQGEPGLPVQGEPGLLVQGRPADMPDYKVNFEKTTWDYTTQTHLSEVVP